MNGTSGLLITLDGQSGVGKTTTGIGNLARHGTFDFRGPELTLLVAADRYRHERTVVRPAITTGAIVVCDRYFASSLVLDPLDGVPPEFLWVTCDIGTAPAEAVASQLVSLISDRASAP